MAPTDKNNAPSSQERDSQERDKLFEMLRKGGFPQTQTAEPGTDAGLSASFSQAISLYTVAETPEDDYRLCRLALGAAKLAQVEQSVLSASFDLARQGQMEKALDALQTLTESEFYKAVLLLLWIEAVRQKELPIERRSKDNAEQVFQRLERYVPLAGTVYWSWFLETEFMVWWAGEVREIMTVEQIRRILLRNSWIGGLPVKLARAGNIPQALDMAFRFEELALPIEGPTCAGFAGKKSEELTEIAEILIRSGDHTQAKEVLEEALATARRIEDSLYRNPALSWIARLFARIGDRDRAIFSARQIQEDADRDNALAEIEKGSETSGNERSQKGAEDECPILWEEKEKLLWKEAESLSKAGDFSGAIEKALGIEKSWNKFQLLLRIARMSVRAGKSGSIELVLQGALESAEKGENFYDRSRMLSLLAETFARMGNEEKAQRVFERIVKAETKEIAQYLQNTAFSQIAAALAQTGRTEEALDVAGRIREDEEKLYALSSVAKSSLGDGKKEEAESVLEKAMACVKSVGHPYGKILALLEIAEALERTGNREKAGPLFRQALDEVARFNAQESMTTRSMRQTFLALLSDCISLSDFRHALSIAGNAYEKGVVLSNIGEAALREDDFPLALEMLQEQDERAKKCGLENILEALLPVAHLANPFLLQARSLFLSRKEIPDEKEAVRRKVEKLSRMGEETRFALLRRAQEIALTIQSEEERIAVWVKIKMAEAQILPGGDEKTGTLFRQSMEFALSMSDPFRKSLALCDLLEGMLLTGNREKAKEAMERALDWVQAIAEAYQKTDILSKIAQALSRRWAEVSLFQQVERAAQSIGEEFSRRRASMQIVKALTSAETPAKNALLGEALVIASTMPEDISEGKSDALIDIAKALGRMEGRDVLSLAEGSLDIARTLVQSHKRSEVLSNLAGALIQAGNREKGEEVFRQATEIAHAIETEFEKNLALWRAAERLAESGYFAEACRAMTSVTDEFMQRQAFSTIVSSQVRSGHFEQALNTSLQLSHASDKTNALHSIIDAASQAGEFDRVPAWLKNASLPTECLIHAVVRCQEGMLAHAADPLLGLRKTLTIFPFDYLLACKGVVHLLVAHIRRQNGEHARRIRQGLEEAGVLSVPVL